MRCDKRAGAFFILAMALIISAFSAAAEHDRMTLLAVREGDDGLLGSVAELVVEVKPGEGRVFLDTYPLLKLDTQMSARFARDIACEFADVDCARYDFFYTISADSVIVGGPSAGSSMAVLTASLLAGEEFPDHTSITGTINAGGFIGPVGGLKEKIDAAAKNGIDTVMIPFGEGISRDSKTNETTDLSEYGALRGVRVIEVTSLDEIFSELYGREANDPGEIMVDGFYNRTMHNLSSLLCGRSGELFEMVYDKADGRALDEAEKEILELAENLSGRAEGSTNFGDAYSAASYCFGANVQLSTLFLMIENKTSKQLWNKARIIEQNAKELDEQISGEEIRTITDLEAFIIVKERLLDTQYRISMLNITSFGKLPYQEVAYASERLLSAYAWAQFYSGSGMQIMLDEEMLKDSCIKRISEAQERLLYVKSILPLGLESIAREVSYAQDDLADGQHALCLFKASKAKAEVDMYLTALTVGPDVMERVLEQKIKLARRVIAEQSREGSFPILGYSYLQYAESLAEADTYSAMLYATYALELGNLDMYISKRRQIRFWKIEEGYFYVFVAGAFTGVFLTLLLAKMWPKRKKEKAVKRKNPSRTSQRNVLLGKKR